MKSDLLLGGYNRLNRLHIALTQLLAGSTQTLTDGANIAFNAKLGVNAKVTLAGNRTLDNPTNLKNGMKGTIMVTQDGTGNRTLAYGTKWLFPGNSHTLTTTAAGIDKITWFYDSASDKIYAELDKAYA